MLSVLFVCTGNICRSPLAEAFLIDRSERLLDGGIRVRSAGIWGRAGHAATAETLSVAAGRGLDLERHRAAPLTAELVEGADLVVGMTTEHREEIGRMVPAAASKTFTLKELAALLRAVEPPPGPDREAALQNIAEAHRLRSGPGRPMLQDEDVADPLGYGEDVYRSVAAEIEEAVDGLVRGLFGVFPVRTRRG